MITYETQILPFKSDFKKVIVPVTKIKKINDFVSELIQKKKQESHHVIDNRSHFKRFYTGTLGEAALEEYLGIDTIIDWTVGDSSHYHKPDLKGIGIKAGIKTVEYGLFPIIFKKSYSPEIIMIKVSDNHIVICGLATKSVLNEFQSDELIQDKYLRKRGTKTGFYGFEHLKAFSTLDELRVLSLN